MGMETGRDKTRQYVEASLRVREDQAKRLRRQLDERDHVSHFGRRFVMLTNLIPNWETYLTPKQREAAVLYVKCLNTREVDYRLGLKPGMAYERLFGKRSSRYTYGGAIRRLEDVYRLFSIKDQARHKGDTKGRDRSSLDGEALARIVGAVRELITLTVEIPDYPRYLSPEEGEMVRLFLETRSLTTTAQRYGMTVDEFVRVLILRDDGVLNRLRTAYTTDVSWDDL